MLGANPAVAYEQYDGNGSEGDFDYVLTILCTAPVSNSIPTALIVTNLLESHKSLRGN